MNVPRHAVFLLAWSLLGCASTARTEPSKPSVQPSIAKLTALVVGTAHKGHLLRADYPLTKLAELLDAYKPDLVLVEIRPEALAKGELEDGPIEMSYITMLAKRAGVPVEGIDWYRDEDVGRDVTGDAEGEKEFDKTYGAIESKLDSFDSFTALNSAERSKAFLDMENARARFGTGWESVWHRRQAWFHFRASEAIKKHGSRRVVAFVGFDHRPELAEFLEGSGASLIDPTSLPTSQHVDTVPDDIVAFWQDAAVRLQAAADRATEQARPRLLAKAKYWTVAVRQHGRCCVEEAALKP